MADIQSNINVNIDTSSALSSIKLLQAQMSAFHTSMSKGTATSANAASQLQQKLIDSVNATRQFSAGIQTIKTTTESFTNSLEKNKLSLGEYFKYSIGATKSFGGLFKSEMSTIDKVARERVKDLQTQYVKLGRDANGAMKAIAIRPLTLDLENLQTKTALAAQKQQILNQLLKQGSTNLLNFGKNTQWAGRQLMVGFTIPLSMAGAAAAKAYIDIEKASIQIQRVYGDLSTTAEETNNMVNQIKNLAAEYTRYGVAISDTMAMAAKAAAMGKTGADLLAQVNNATRLSVLGGVEQEQALETTISLTNAFGTAADQLSSKINFLNAVENQTVTSIEDLTIAVPKAGPVIQQLGGDVEDLAFFLTAMKEGGINASEGANALKSGLAALINPTGKAADMLASYGINVRKIVDDNKGDVKQTVIDFAKALDTLDPLNRARAIEQMFGKFQFARLSTLFQNVVKEGSQASKTLALANTSAIQLAAMSKRELDKLESSPVYKFQKTLADLQLAIAPIGETFLKAVTPVLQSAADFLSGFNKMGEGFKQFVVVGSAVLGGLAPILLMVTGLVANGAANIIKLFANVKAFINRATSSSQVLGQTTNYLTTEQIKAEAVAASLDQVHTKLTQTFTSESSAIANLLGIYSRANAEMAKFALPGIPTTMGKKAKKMATGGFVPGSGNGDTVPAMLTPGEFVVKKSVASKNMGVLSALNSGKVSLFSNGGPVKPNFVSPSTINASQGTTDSINKFVAAITDGSIKINKSEEVLAKTLSQLADGTKSSLQKFFQRLAVNAEEIAGQSVANQVNNYYQGPMGKKGRAIRYSARGVGTIEKQMGAAGRLDELSRAKTRLQAEAAQGLPGQIQIDRAHRVDVGKSGKLFKQAWTSEAFNPQTHSENAISNSLSGENRVAGFFEKYSQNLKGMLDKGLVTQEEYSSIMDKATNNLALSEKELKIQSKVLTRITRSEQDFLSKNTALRNDIQRARAGASVRGGLATSGNAGNISAQAQKMVMEDLNAAKSGILTGVKVSTRQASPSKEAFDAGKNIGIGSIQGIESVIPKAAAAGEKIGTAVTTRTAATGSKTPRRFSQAQTNYDMLNLPMQGPARPTRMQSLQSKFMGIKSKASSKTVGDLSSGKLAGLGAAASMATFALSGMPGPIGQVANAILPVVSIFSIVSPLLTTFGASLGIASLPILPVAAGLAGLVAVVGITAFMIKQANDARKKELESINASSKAYKYAKDSVSKFAEAAGVEKKSTVSDFATQSFKTKATPGQMGDVETLLASDDFTNKDSSIFKMIENVKKMTDAQAKAFIQSYGQNLIASGIGKESVDAEIKAIQAAAGKAKLNLTFDSIDLTSKKAQDDMLRSFNGLQKQFGVFSNAGALLAKNEKDLAKYRNAYRTLADQASNSLRGISDQFASGTIDGETYDRMMNGIVSRIGAMTDKATQARVIKRMFSELSPEAKAFAGSIGDANQQLKIYQILILGGADAMGKLQTEIARAKSSGGTAEQIKGWIDELINTSLKDVKGAAKALNDALASVVGSSAASESSKKTVKTMKELLKSIQEVNTSLSHQTTAFIRLTAAGIKAADAMKLIQDGDIARIIATEKDAKKREELIALIKRQLELEKKLKETTAPEQNAIDKANRKIAVLELQNKLSQLGLDRISKQEDVINKAYDKRIEALDKVLEINKEIAAQQQDQLDLTSALAKGDMAAASRAAQKLRAAAAERAMANQRKALENSKASAIAGVRTDVNGVSVSREQIENSMSTRDAEINKIQTEQVVPNEIKLAEQAVAGDESPVPAVGGYGDLTNKANKPTAAPPAGKSWYWSDQNKKWSLADSSKIDKNGKYIGSGSNVSNTGSMSSKTPQPPVKTPPPPIITRALYATTSQKDQLKDLENKLAIEKGLWPRVINKNSSKATQESHFNRIAGYQSAINELKKKYVFAAGGGMVPKAYAKGGFAMGTDTVPAMLTPGEFVVKKSAVDNFGVNNLKAINDGSAVGDSVYNYSISVNAGSNASTDDIARAVMAKIKQVDSQRIRGNTF